MSSSNESEDKKEETPQKKPAATVPEKAEQPTIPTTPSVPASEAPKPVAPSVGTPKPSTSIGAPSTPPVGARPTSTPIGQPKPVGTPVAPPVGARPTSTPIGQAKPVGATPSAATAARPPTPTGPLKPTVPQKREETKQEVSRRNFLKGLAVLGGIVALAQFAPVVGGFMNGSTEGTATPKQAIIDLKTGLPLKTTDISENNWTTFVYPRTDNPNIDSDTFRQCVLIHIPKNFTAPSSLSVKDPISGDTFVALSRVCVHLWCLWSYFPSDDKGICPCHGSQYVPGDGPPYHEPPGYAVGGPASLQAPPNNMLPVITLSADPDGTLYATGIVGQVGCGQKC